MWGVVFFILMKIIRKLDLGFVNKRNIYSVFVEKNGCFYFSFILSFCSSFIKIFNCSLSSEVTFLLLLSNFSVFTFFFPFQIFLFFLFSFSFSVINMQSLYVSVGYYFLFPSFMDIKNINYSSYQCKYV